MLFLLLLSSALSADELFYAEASFYDESGYFHSISLPYFVSPERRQLGVKFGVQLYNIPIKDCKASVDPAVDEYFAAYLKPQFNCTVADIITDVENHGADFIFVDLSEGGSFPMENKYDEPVFMVQQSDLKDGFMVNGNTTSRFINILFPLVRSSAGEELFPSQAYLLLRAGPALLRQLRRRSSEGLGETEGQGNLRASSNHLCLFF